MEKEVIVSKGKFRIDNSDGTFTEMNFIMPKEIAERFLCSLGAWKDKWVATTTTHEAYQKAEKAFLEKLTTNSAL